MHGLGRRCQWQGTCSDSHADVMGTEAVKKGGEILALDANAE
jgi:hypothetical protein